jgi:hypothetical protein
VLDEGVGVRSPLDLPVGVLGVWARGREAGVRATCEPGVGDCDGDARPPLD